MKVNHPGVVRRYVDYSLDWKLPREYGELVKKITPEFRRVMEKRAGLVIILFE